MDEKIDDDGDDKDDDDDEEMKTIIIPKFCSLQHIHQISMLFRSTGYRIVCCIPFTLNKGCNFEYVIRNTENIRATQ